MHAHTITTILVIGGAWIGVLTFILCLLRMAKRSDEAMPPDGSLAAVATEIQWVLGAERVTVVMADPFAPATGKVGACLGAPDLVGCRVQVAAARGTGVVRPVEAVGLGLGGVDVCPAVWTFAHVPLAGDGHLVGAVTAASRSRAFTDDDLAVIERVARTRGRPFDRRRRRR